MSLRLQCIIICFMIVVLAMLINAVRKNTLDIKYSLVWIFLIIVIMILTVFKGMLVCFSDLMGIASPVNMLFFCGFCFSLVIIYTLTVALSKMSHNIRKLTQEIGILHNKLEDLKMENNKDDAKDNCNE